MATNRAWFISAVHVVDDVYVMEYRAPDIALDEAVEQLNAILRIQGFSETKARWDNLIAQAVVGTPDATASEHDEDQWSWRMFTAHAAGWPIMVVLPSEKPCKVCLRCGVLGTDVWSNWSHPTTMTLPSPAPTTGESMRVALVQRTTEYVYTKMQLATTTRELHLARTDIESTQSMQEQLNDARTAYDQPISTMAETAPRRVPLSRGKKRTRKVFTGEQRLALEQSWLENAMPSDTDVLDLAQRIGDTQERVRAWFTNQNIGWRKVRLSTGELTAQRRPKTAKRRGALTTKQRVALEEYRLANADPPADIEALAKRIGAPTQHVEAWFRRTRRRRPSV